MLISHGHSAASAFLEDAPTGWSSAPGLLNTASTCVLREAGSFKAVQVDIRALKAL